jgi:hypothetical protein
VFQGVSSSGFFNVVPDDGVPAASDRIPSKLYPSLSLAAAKPHETGDLNDAKGCGISEAGQRVIPLDPKGNLLVRYRGKGKPLTRFPPEMSYERGSAERRKIAFLNRSWLGRISVYLWMLFSRS